MTAKYFKKDIKIVLLFLYISNSLKHYFPFSIFIFLFIYIFNLKQKNKKRKIKGKEQKNVQYSSLSTMQIKLKKKIVIIHSFITHKRTIINTKKNEQKLNA